MGLTRRKKRGRPLLRKRHPKKKRSRVLKPSFTLPPKLQTLIDASGSNWDKSATVLKNYSSLGFLSNPNLVRNSKLVRCQDLQLAPPPLDHASSEFDHIDSGSDLEEDDLKLVIGKKRRDGKNTDTKPLTTVQRYHVKRLIDRHGDNYEEMFRDMKLNVMQFSVGVLKRLCGRYLTHGDKNPIIHY